MGKNRKPLHKQKQNKKRDRPCRVCFEWEKGSCPKCHGKGCQMCNYDGNCKCARKARWDP